MTEFNHIILTRFNMREDINNPSIPSEKWHKDRFELFEKFCFPSVKNQINFNFKWLVFFDVLTPRHYLSKIEYYATELPNFIPIFSNDLADFRKHIHQNIYGDISFLITTRLDNDDSISNDFIDCVQKQFNHQEFEFINFYNGYIYYNKRLYNHHDKSNAFLSLIEKISDQNKDQLLKTVWCTMHHKASDVANIVQIKNNSSWLQVIHSTNVSNRVKGIRSREYTNINEKFGIYIDWDNDFFYWFDFLLLSYLRAFREFLFNILKNLIRTP
jgi:hypothetical protein